MAKDSETVAARRRRLKQWIDERFYGSQIAFIEDAEMRGQKINQGELSGLLASKSFGEKKASTLERQGNMPRGYLSFPLADVSASGAEPNPPAPASEITELRLLLGLTAQALAASTPIAGRELVKAIRDKVGSAPRTAAGELVTLLESQLADLADTFPRKHKVRGSR